MEKKIRQLIKKWGTADPFKLCDHLNIIVVFQPLEPEVLGAYKYFKRNRIIVINSNLSEMMQLKTCAHELGHALLHTKVNTVFLQHKTYLKTSPYEKEADRFGDILLSYYLSDTQEYF